MAISITDFTLAAPSGLTVKTASLAALDTSGAVTHGVVTESATPPLAGDGSWVAWNGADGTRPAGLQSKTLTAGAHTLYGHVKDGAGNRGSSAGQGVTVSAGSATGVYGQGQFPGDYSSAKIRLRSNGTDGVGYMLDLTNPGDGDPPYAVLYRNGVPVSSNIDWPGATYIRFENDNGTGGVRVRSGESTTGPWTTIYEWTDPTPVTGGSTSGPGLPAYTSGTY